MYTLPPWWNHNIKKKVSPLTLYLLPMLYTQIKLTYISGLYTPRLLILLFESRYIERGRWNLATRSGVCQVNRVRDERHAWTTFLMQKDVRFSNKIRFGGVLCVRGTRWRHRPPAPRRSFDQIRGVARFQYSNHARLTHIAVLSLYFASGCV